TKYICRPEQMSSLRTIISISVSMPALGRRFYAAGPATGIARLKAYLESQVAANILAIEDCEIAAAQFIDTCLSTLFKPMMFYDAPPPSEAMIDHVTGVAVRAFLAAYTKR
ncbi:MAG: TetR/AcrR family transcriptional regulator C-terminal domain-containing protein, partial [Alphaproteobacteria bacterium]